MRRRPLVAVGVALTVLGVVLLTLVLQRDAESVAATVASTPRASSSPTPDPRTTAPRATPSPRPTRVVSALTLRIPSIDLERPVTGRGLSSDGTIDPPSGTVMWFTGYERVRPGSTGTAVIAGHVATAQRRDAFADLADVHVGDTVEVLDTNGRRLRYTVTRAGAIDKQKVTTDQDVWGVNTTTSRLAIITCDDAFGYRKDGHRVANYVVIAERR